MTSMSRLILSSISVVFLAGSMTSHGQEAISNLRSDRYVINQTFGGESFFKDNNVWVYNKKFADTFGMPPNVIDDALRGIEAAAFRIEDYSFKLCGMGGKAENCKEIYRCVTDIYIDESKHSLPWATEQKADWYSRYNSVVWLRTQTEWGSANLPPPGVIANKAIRGGIRPFADPESHREVNFFQNGQGFGNDDLNYNLVSIIGYKRYAISGLTLISLDYHCSARNETKPIVTFRLESREEIASPALKRFFEFQLPEAFSNKIEATLQARWARDREYYKSLLNIK